MKYKFNFTRGPWLISTIPIELRGTDSAASIWGHSEREGAPLIADISRSPGDEQATANAKLIAAAPEMEHALRTLLHALTTEDPESFPGHHQAYLNTVGIPRAIEALVKAGVTV